MDEDRFGSSRISFSWSVTDINLRWNGMQWWIVDLFLGIGLCT